MTSAYGTAKVSPGSLGQKSITHLPYLPWKRKLKNGEVVFIDFLRTDEDVEVVKMLLNTVIEEGMSWPFEEPLTDQQFREYFFSHAALVVRNPAGVVMGTFYCKPNFPGRCSHYCNGGFITDPRFRRQGVAYCMGRAFIRIAKDIGFRAVLFNLVFTSNIASSRLWDSLGFRRLATLPKVGRLRQGSVDAVQYYYDLEDREERKRPRGAAVLICLRSHLPRICLFAAAFAIGRLSAGGKGKVGD